MRWLKSLFKFREQSDGDGEMIKPFLEHMEDLRWTIVRMLVTQVITTVLAFWFRVDLVHILKAPLQRLDPVPHLVSPGIADSFIISLELAFFAGLALAFPFHVYAVARFVLPALTKKERHYLVPGIGAGFLFFLAGAYLAYQYILPATLEFFWKDAQGVELTPLWTWKAYFSFAVWLCFGFGALCEVPVIVVMLAMLGLVSFQFLRRTRPYAYTGILILGAVIAPTPDPMMLMAMSMPILLMYEACIWVVWLIDRRKRTGEGARADGPDQMSLLAFLIFGGVACRGERAVGRM
jgi:sec-independent protein translocase protein TatC